MNTKGSSPAKRNKKILRTHIRAQRRTLTPLQQNTASLHLRKHLEKSLILLCAQHIALYLGNDGEICPKILIEAYLKRKKCIYLPVIHPIKKNLLVFCRFTSNMKLKKNRYGILEPSFKYSRCIPPQYLSLVLLPLVAFDEQGNRMGMGAGYYDRTFEFKKNKTKRPPRLIGLAHEFQKQEELPTEAWDIPLLAVFTDKGIYRKP